MCESLGLRSLHDTHHLGTSMEVGRTGPIPASALDPKSPPVLYHDGSRCNKQGNLTKDAGPDICSHMLECSPYVLIRRQASGYSKLETCSHLVALRGMNMFRGRSCRAPHYCALASSQGSAGHEFFEYCHLPRQLTPKPLMQQTRDQSLKDCCKATARRLRLDMAVELIGARS